MLSFIKEDFLILKSNVKYLFLLIVIYALLDYATGPGIIYAIPIVGIFSYYNIFNYEKSTNFDTYVAGLPSGKKKMVLSKYLGSVLLCLMLTILTIIISLLLLAFKNTDGSIWEVLLTNAAIFLIGITVVALNYPFIFKYGIEKGRIALFGIMIIVPLGLALIIKLLSLMYILKYFMFIITYYYITIPVIVLALFVGSIYLSHKIYLKREF